MKKFLIYFVYYSSLDFSSQTAVLYDILYCVNRTFELDLLFIVLFRNVRVIRTRIWEVAEGVDLG